MLRSILMLCVTVLIGIGANIVIDKLEKDVVEHKLHKEVDSQMEGNAQELDRIVRGL